MTRLCRPSLSRFAARGLRGAAVGIALASLCLSGCAAKPHWAKKGATSGEIEHDWNDCRRQSDAAAGVTPDTAGRGASSPWAEGDRRDADRQSRAGEDACMRAKGYFPTSGSASGR